jgi:hypothetical protein
VSRSYKKHPCIKDTGRYTYQDKRNANKSVRHTKDIPNGGKYKQCFCSWDIADWVSYRYSWKDAWDSIVACDEDRLLFCTKMLHKPYDKKRKTKKELMRMFHKRIGK